MPRSFLEKTLLVVVVVVICGTAEAVSVSNMVVRKVVIVVAVDA
jgi:hypothetical protein